MSVSATFLMFLCSQVIVLTPSKLPRGCGHLWWRGGCFQSAGGDRPRRSHPRFAFDLEVRPNPRLRPPPESLASCEQCLERAAGVWTTSSVPSRADLTTPTFACAVLLSFHPCPGLGFAARPLRARQVLHALNWVSAS